MDAEHQSLLPARHGSALSRPSESPTWSRRELGAFAVVRGEEDTRPSFTAF